MMVCSDHGAFSLFGKSEISKSRFKNLDFEDRAGNWGLGLVVDVTHLRAQIMGFLNFRGFHFYGCKSFFGPKLMDYLG